MATRQYIGARYVPKFANPVEWDNTNEYEPLTIVTYEGNSYTSRKPVPVGIEITNDEYWAETGNYNAQVEQYKNLAENIGWCSPEQFKEDGDTDDTASFQRCITYAEENGCNIIARADNYTISVENYLNPALVIDFSKIKKFIVSGNIYANCEQDDSGSYVGTIIKVTGDGGELEAHLIGQAKNGGYDYTGYEDFTSYGNHCNYIGLLVDDSVRFSTITVSASRFEIGCKLSCKTGGIAFNKFYLGEFEDNAIGVDVVKENTGGYCSSNLFVGGTFNQTSTNSNRGKCIGIRLGGGTQGTWYPNTNLFINTGLEGSGLPVYIISGNNNNFDNVRVEAQSGGGIGGFTYAMRVDNCQRMNKITTQYEWSQPNITGAYKTMNVGNSMVFDDYNMSDKIFEYNADDEDMLYYQDDSGATTQFAPLTNKLDYVRTTVAESETTQFYGIPNASIDTIVPTNGYYLYNNYACAKYFNIKPAERMWVRVNGVGTGVAYVLIRFYDTNGVNITDTLVTGSDDDGWVIKPNTLLNVSGHNYIYNNQRKGFRYSVASKNIFIPLVFNFDTSLYDVKSVGIFVYNDTEVANYTLKRFLVYQHNSNNIEDTAYGFNKLASMRDYKPSASTKVRMGKPYVGKVVFTNAYVSGSDNIGNFNGIGFICTNATTGAVTAIKAHTPS